MVRKPKNRGPLTKEFTINLKRDLHKCTFKKKAPRAVKRIREFVAKEMHTKEVLIDVKLNKAVWSRGIRSIPNRLRIIAQRKRKEDDEAEDDMYCMVTIAEDQTTRGKTTEIITDA